MAKYLKLNVELKYFSVVVSLANILKFILELKYCSVLKYNIDPPTNRRTQIFTVL